MNAQVKNKISARGLGIVLGLAFVAVFTLALLPKSALAATNTLTIPVEQIFSADPPGESAGTFSYELRALNGGPLPGGAIGDTFTFTLAGNVPNPPAGSAATPPIAGAHQVGPITFNTSGMFTYTLRLASTPSAEEYTVDSRVYTITVIVEETPTGSLLARIASIYYEGNVRKQERIIFEHSFISVAEIPDPRPTDPSLMLDPEVRKTVQGNPAEAYTFTFRLEAAEVGQPLPGGLTSTAQRRHVDITITGSGSGSFGTWAYTETGTFIYTVREIASSNSDYVFDTSVFTIRDVVTRSGDQLLLNRTVTNQDNREVSSLIFINFFVGGDTEVQETPPATPGETTPAAPGTTRPVPGPKTGDYTDPMHMIIAMTLSGFVVLIALLMIYTDRKNEEDFVVATECNNKQIVL